MLVGAAGLATDTIQWALWKRQLQRAADSAAMAGVYASVASQSIPTGVSTDLANNNHTMASLLSSSPQVAYPTSTSWSNGVQVTLEAQKTLGFSSLFMSAAPTITAQATAAVVREGEYCVVALNNNTTASIQINGNVTVNMGCGMISNSTSTTAAISVSGTSHIVNATPVAAVGKVPAINGTNDEKSYQLKQSDPYAGKYSTSVPSGMNCKTLTQQISAANTTVTSGGSTYEVINPGCYKDNGNSGNNSAFTTSNQNIALNPGTYYIDSSNFDIGANTKIIVNPGAASNAGVTIILTGSSPGVVNVSSNSEVVLRAPSDGSTYNKMLFIQSGSATGSSLISGNANSSFDGSFYFPNTEVTFNGTSDNAFKCAMIVANIVEFSGNSNVQNNTTGCTAATKQTVQRVRLVA